MAETNNKEKLQDGAGTLLGKMYAEDETEAKEPTEEEPQEEPENGEEEEKESWPDYFRRRLREDGTPVMPNISWYLAEQIFRVKKIATVDYTPMGTVIPLTAPCLNIWALKDPSHKLERTLGLTYTDVEKVNYCACYIVTSGADGLKAGTILTESEYREALEKYGEAFAVAIGTEGLLEYAQNTGKDINDSIIRELPVIFPNSPKDGTAAERRLRADLSDDLSYLYIKVLDQSLRTKRLDELNAPEIIMRNEKRMLQEFLDQTIQNGLRGCEWRDRNGGPMLSWADMEA